MDANAYDMSISKIMQKDFNKECQRIFSKGDYSVCTEHKEAQRKQRDKIFQKVRLTKDQFHPKFCYATLKSRKFDQICLDLLFEFYLLV